MTRTERHAWFNIIVYTTGLVGLGILWPVIHWWAWCSLIVWGLIPLGVLFYLPMPGQKNALFDERDRQIVSEAMKTTTHVFWWTAAGGCWLPFFIFGIQGKIPACFVSMYSLAAGLIWIFVLSIRIILLYRKDRDAAVA
jgi:hypothetical protein